MVHGKWHRSYTIFSSTHAYPYVSKWLNDSQIHQPWSNLFGDSKFITDAQISQSLKLSYIHYMGNQHQQQIFNPQILLICNLCRLKQNDKCLHLLSWCSNKHVNTLRTHRPNKVVHALSATLFFHPTSRHFTLKM